MCQYNEDITLNPLIRIRILFPMLPVRPITLPALGQWILVGIHMNTSKIPYLSGYSVY